MIEVVPMTREHYDAIYGEPLKLSLRGVAALVDGKPEGVMAFHLARGQNRIVFKATEELRKHPMTIMRMAKKMEQMGVRSATVTCDDDIEAAPRFLERLGFVPVDGNEWKRFDG